MPAPSIPTPHETIEGLDLTAQGGGLAALLAQLFQRLRRLEIKISAIGSDVSNLTRTLGVNGQVTIANPATSATVTLPAPQQDTAYRPLLTTEVAAGTPAAGSLRASAATKTTTTFVVQLEAAPGAGNSVNVNWALTRPFTG